MENKRMPSVVEQVRGVSYKPTDLHASLDKDSITLLRANNIEDGKIIFSDVVFVDRKCVSTNQILKKGDILICASSGSRNLVGKAASFSGDGEYTFGAFCKVVRPHYLEDADYIAMYFQSPIYRRLISEAAQGININNIRNEHIDALTVKWGSNDMRGQIVERLQTLQIIIQQRHEQLYILDQLIKARFVELYKRSELSDETTIEAITEKVKVGFVGTCEKYYTDESGVPMLRTGNITQKGIDLSDLKYVTEEFHNKNKKSQIHSGDVLIARHGSNGQANVYAGPEAQCLNAVVIVPNRAKTTSVFLAGLINSPMVKVQIDRTLVGSTQHVVNTKSIANLKVRIPDIAVQKEYEAFVSQIDKSKAVIQSALDRAQTLFDSLMQQYFG